MNPLCNSDTSQGVETASCRYDSAMPAHLVPAKCVPTAVALLAVGLIAVGPPAFANATNDGSGLPEPPGHQYADAIGSELTSPVVSPQAEPSLFATTVPQVTSRIGHAWRPEAWCGGPTPGMTAGVIGGEAPAPQDGQSMSPAAPASPIVPVAAQ